MWSRINKTLPHVILREKKNKKGIRAQTFLISAPKFPHAPPIPFSARHLMKGDPPDIMSKRETKKEKTSDNEMTEANTEFEKSATLTTFKEKLVGDKLEGKEIKLGEIEEIDLDDDYVIADLSSSHPSIRFLDKVYNEIKNSIKQIAIIRLLAGCLGYNGLEAAIKAIGKLK